MALFRKMGKNFVVNHDSPMSTLSVFQATRSMSSAKLFVGGLSDNTDETRLQNHFARYGEVLDAKIIMDRKTGMPRGFGFVTFATAEEASAALETMNLAIKAMKNQDLYGRMVRVNYAIEKPHPGFGGGDYGVPGSYHGSHLKTSYAAGGDQDGELSRNPDLGYVGQLGSDQDDEINDEINKKVVEFNLRSLLTELLE